MTAPVLPDPVPHAAEPAEPVLPTLPGTRTGRSHATLLLGAVALVGAVLIALAWQLAGLSSASSTTAAAPPPPVPTPVLSVVGDRQGQVPWDQPLALTASEAVLTTVTGTDPDGLPIQGTLIDGHHWQSAGTLIPAATYRLLVTVRDSAGRPHTSSETVQTAPATHVLHAVISPGDGDLVGVGQTVIVTLDQPVVKAADRAQLERRLSVTSTPAVHGAWHWMSDEELHYRGPSYWAAGSTVHASADLLRLELSGGTWGSGRTSVTYHVGDALVSTVDVAAHTMTVRRNGVVLRVMPASMGRPGYPTYGGVHLVLEKLPSRIMDSSTTGHPKGTPDYYRETVYWTVRISYGGAFVHSAPWSVADQGHRNVSHGCINLSPANAEWYYGLARRGDVVDVVNADAGPRLYDPGMSDWNIPFAQWASGSSAA